MYAKIFASLFQGTLYGKANEILVFVNLLTHCDREGYVDRHPRVIAGECGLSIDATRAALIELESPDPQSRTPDHDGARIARVDEHRDWGWFIINYSKYRDIGNAETIKLQAAERAKRFRERHPPVTHRNAPITQDNAPVTSGDANNAMHTHDHAPDDSNSDAEIGKGTVGQNLSDPDQTRAESGPNPDEAWSKDMVPGKKKKNPVGLSPDRLIEAEKIVEYLNAKCSRHYRHDSAKAIECFKKRFDDGYTYSDFVQVIDNQYEEWKNKSEWQKYWRPETLFGNKFDGYLNNHPPKTRDEQAVDALAGMKELLQGGSHAVIDVRKGDQDSQSAISTAPDKGSPGGLFLAPKRQTD